MEAKEKKLVLRFEGPGAPLEAITLLREALKNARPFHLERVELPPLLPSGEWEDGKLMTYRDGAVSLVVDGGGGCVPGRGGRREVSSGLLDQAGASFGGVCWGE